MPITWHERPFVTGIFRSLRYAFARVLWLDTGVPSLNMTCTPWQLPLAWKMKNLPDPKYPKYLIVWELGYYGVMVD